MDLSPVKHEVLEDLLLHEKPVKAGQVAKEIGKERPAVQMHLIGLTRMGYAESPQKGYYIISENGKIALGLPKVTKENALSMLKQTPEDKAFYFYVEIGKPLNIHARGLREFSDIISQVNVESIEFHMSRRDFEAWFNVLGDIELEKKMALLKNRKVMGEDLRRQIREITKARYTLLSQKAS